MLHCTIEKINKIQNLDKALLYFNKALLYYSYIAANN